MIETLFQPLRLGKVQIKNRIAMAPMNTGFLNTDGSLSDAAYAYYLERARGGVGMIIVEAGAVYIHTNRPLRIHPNYRDVCVTPTWSKLIDAVHSFGTKIVAQINDNGFSTPLTNNDHWRENLTASPSDFQGEKPGRAMTGEEIQTYLKYIEFKL